MSGLELCAFSNFFEHRFAVFRLFIAISVEYQHIIMLMLQMSVMVIIKSNISKTETHLPFLR